MPLSPGLLKLLHGFVATSAAMVDAVGRIEWYARAHTPIVLVGEPGTGKTALAQVIHAASGRTGPFAAHTARELDPQLERSQLFGHEAGAFTGAHGRHIGILEEAADGTLLLDDLHHLRRSTQMLLLRALGDGQFRRVGGSRDLPVRCRFVFGLTRSPDALVRRRKLIPELRSRLGFSVIHLPRLEDRIADIPLLAQWFLERCPADVGKLGPTRLTDEVVSALRGAAWPGNVRDLGMVIREGYLRAEGSDVLELRHVAEVIRWRDRYRQRGDPAANLRAIRRALEITKGGVSKAARISGAGRTTIYRYLARFGCAESENSRERGQSHSPAQTVPWDNQDTENPRTASA